MAKFLYIDDTTHTRKILIVNPNKWLDRRFNSQYFGINDESVRLLSELDNP